MKKLLVVMLIGALFMFGCGKSASIPVTGEWEPFTDANDNGDSTIEMEIIEKGGMTAYRLYGEVTEAFQYGFTGWQINPDEDTLEALKKAKGISFKVTGDGQLYSVKYRVSTITDWAHHEYRFEAEAGKELTIEVPINMFTQPSWGTPVGALNERLMNNVFDISWQTHESWRPGPYDITIWDVRIMQ
ncbi:MAG: CIA30 family protein [Treponema sp.]|nr:CIA30 family protein [Treponema sp.]